MTRSLVISGPEQATEGHLGSAAPQVPAARSKAPLGGGFGGHTAVNPATGETRHARGTRIHIAAPAGPEGTPGAAVPPVHALSRPDGTAPQIWHRGDGRQMVKVAGLELPLSQAISAGLIVHRPTAPEPAPVAGSSPGEPNDPPAKPKADDPEKPEAADQEGDPLGPLSEAEVADYAATANALEERLVAHGDNLTDLLDAAWQTTVVSGDGSIELSSEVTGKLDAALGAAKADEVAGALFTYFEAQLASAIQEAGITGEAGAAIGDRLGEHPQSKNAFISLLRGQPAPMVAVLRSLATGP